jgi:hypothetical protein
LTAGMKHPLILAIEPCQPDGPLDDIV